MSEVTPHQLRRDSGSSTAGVPPRTLTDLDFRRILDRLAHHTRTVLGRARALTPRLLTDVDAIRHELRLTAEMRGLIERGDPPPFGGITDVREVLAHAARRGVLEPEELIQVADALRGIWLMIQFVGRQDAVEAVAALAEGLPELDDLRETLYDAFDDHGQLQDHASPELAELRARRRTLHERIHKRIQQLLADWDVQEHLQDSYFTVREDRYVLPVRSGERAEVEGIIHGSSQTGRTLFVEPAELVPINNELKLCEQAVLLEEQRILAQLTGLIGEHRAEIVQGLDIMATLDVIAARGHFAIELDASEPKIPTGTEVHLRRARNPLLLVRGVPVVANDIDLGDDCRMLVITGPNAGGKTVTLSTLGLCALMLRSGMQVPAAPDSVLPVFDGVLSVMGDNQDLQADLSTFSGHLARLSEVLAAAHEGALVLLDELAVGTEPGQGAALAIAVLEALLDRGAVGAVTTHFERLKTLSLEDPRFQNASVWLDPDSKDPTYQLRRGVSGASSALEMARRLGLDDAIVDRAAEMLGDKGLSFERALERLDEERTRLAAERDALTAARSKAEREAASLKREREQLEQRADALVEEWRAGALAEIADAREAVRRVVRELQKAPTARGAQRRRVELAEIEKSLERPGARRERPKPSDDLRIDEVSVGDTVFVPSFNREGRVEEIRGSNAVVAIGGLRTTVAVAGLRRPASTEAEEPAPRRAPVDLAPDEAPPRAADNTIDVRGKRVDEAMREVERFLDEAVLQNRSAAYVLHGHGTGRLKVGLREALARSPYVARFEAADPDKGGDAVTLIWLE